MRSVRSSQKSVATTQVQANVGISRENVSESTGHRSAHKHACLIENMLMIHAVISQCCPKRAVVFQ